METIHFMIWPDQALGPAAMRVKTQDKSLELCAPSWPRLSKNNCMKPLCLQYLCDLYPARWRVLCNYYNMNCLSKIILIFWGCHFGCDGMHLFSAPRGAPHGVASLKVRRGTWKVKLSPPSRAPPKFLFYRIWKALTGSIPTITVLRIFVSGLLLCAKLWKCKSCFSNRALVKATFEALNIVFLRPLNWPRPKPYY